VGVTYCGNLTIEADQLIDRVKNYTNLFVLDSGDLIRNLNATEQICDYAISSGLSIIVYYGANGEERVCDSLLSIVQARWGSQFLGLYYCDELGGKMIDGQLNLIDNGKKAVIKNSDGSVLVNEVRNQQCKRPRRFGIASRIWLGVAKPERSYLGLMATRQLFSKGLECPASVSCQIRVKTRHNLQ
jgi:hypothetical protein